MEIHFMGSILWLPRIDAMKSRGLSALSRAQLPLALEFIPDHAVGAGQGGGTGACDDPAPELSTQLSVDPSLGNDAASDH